MFRHRFASQADRRSRTTQANGRRRRLTIESLEDRQVPTIGFSNVTGIGGQLLSVNAIAKDAAGDTYSSGSFSGSANFAPAGATPVNLKALGAADAFLAKYDPSGNLLWVRDLGGSGINTAAANSLALDSAGNVTLAGQFTGSLQANPGGVSALLTGGASYDQVGFVARYDASGNYRWAKAFDNGLSEIARSVTLDAAGNAYVAGILWSNGSFGRNAGGTTLTTTNAGGSDGYLVKLDAAGNSVWATSLGGASTDQATRVAADASGNVYVAGTYSSTAKFGATSLSSSGGNDTFLTKLNATSGSVVWAQGFGGSSDDSVGGLDVDGSGNVVLGGTFFGSVGFGATTISSGGSTIPGAFVAKLTSGGSVSWAQALTSTQGGSLGDVQVDSAGSVYVGGNFVGVGSFGGTALYSSGGVDPYTVKLNASGVYQWQMHGGGPGTDTVTALAVGGVDNVTMAGSFGVPSIFGDTTLAGANPSNVYYAQIGTQTTAVPSGTLSFTNVSSFGANTMTIGSVAKDAAGNTYSSGTFSGTGNFAPAGATPVNLKALGASDAFLAKYDPSGNLLWVRDLGGSGINTAAANSLALDSAGNVTLAGQFTGSLQANPGGVSALLTGGASYDQVGFVARYDASGNYRWAKAFDNGLSEIARSVTLDAAGNAYVAGILWSNGSFGRNAGGTTLTTTNAGGSDGYLVKLDAAGNSVWATSLGGASTDQATRVAADASGNVYVAGTYSSTAKFGATSLSSSGGNDTFLTKLNATSGSVVWAQGFGGSSDDSVGGLDVDGSGNVVLGGTFFNTMTVGAINLSVGNTIYPEGFVAEITPSGSASWAKSLTTTMGGSVGDVAVDSANSVYVGGNFAGVATLGGPTVYSSGGVDPYVLKLNSTGVYQWQMHGGGPLTDTVTSLGIGGVDNVAMAGTYGVPALFGPTTLVSSMIANTYIAQIGYPAATTTPPAPTLGFSNVTGIGGQLLSVNAIAKDAAGNTFSAGTFSGTGNFAPAGATPVNLKALGAADAFLAKYDPSGNLLWVRDLGGSGINTAAANSLALDSAGNVTLAGQFTGSLQANPGGVSALLTGGASYDQVGFVARYDASGNYRWAKAFDNGLSEIARSVTLDAAGNAYVAGILWSNGSFGRNAGGTTLTTTNAGGSDGYLVKLDAAGNSVWATSLGGASTDQATRVAADASGNVYVAGTYSSTAKFGATSLSSSGGNDTFLTKLNATSGSVVWAQSFGGSSDDSVGGLDVDGSGNVVLGGTFFGSVGFGATTISSGGSTIPGAFVAKLTSGGSVSWAQALTSTQGGSLGDVQVDSAGSVYVGGNFVGVGSFGGTALYSSGGVDPYTVKLNASGVYQWQMHGGGPGTDTVTALAVGGVDNVTMAGSFGVPSIFGDTTLAGANPSNVYYARISY